MRIAVVNPNTTASMTDAAVAAAREVARPDTTVVGFTAPNGVPSVETSADEVLGALGALQAVVAAERVPERPDAYVIACFGDTGLQAARETAVGPVVGMSEAALMAAAVIAYRFTVVTLPPRTIAMSDRVVQGLGLTHRCTVRAVDEPVAEIAEGSVHLLALFVDEGRRAIAEDGAEAIVLGCAGLADLRLPLQEALGVPVIEGVMAAVGIAESLVAQGLTTSQAGPWARVDGGAVR